jgi:hypothetical protein
MGLCHILGDFFKNSPGRTGGNTKNCRFIFGHTELRPSQSYDSSYESLTLDCRTQFQDSFDEDNCYESTLGDW